MLKACVKTVSNVFIRSSIKSVQTYTVLVAQRSVIGFYSGIVRVIHQSIRLFPIQYSTGKFIFSPFKSGRFTQFPQGLLLPTERIFN